MLENRFLTLKNLLLPIFCKACDRRVLTEENGYFCPACWEMSPRVVRPFCTMCGKPHQGMAGFGTLSNFPCAECREAKARPFRRAYGAAVYAGAVQQAIRLLKFYDRPRLARPLGEMMVAFALQEMEADAYDFILPVPLHRVRERDRGYNQSFLLARELVPAFPAARLDLSLHRIRPTAIQSRTSSPKQRRDNVRGAFAVIGDTLAGARVLLVDDVVTTGGTTTECALALKRAGVTEVDVFAAALAVRGAALAVRGAVQPGAQTATMQ